MDRDNRRQITVITKTTPGIFLEKKINITIQKILKIIRTFFCCCALLIPANLYVRFSFFLIYYESIGSANNQEVAFVHLLCSIRDTIEINAFGDIAQVNLMLIFTLQRH